MSASMQNWIRNPLLRFLLALLATYCFVNVIEAISGDIHDYLLCRKCGKEIVQIADLVNNPSKLSIRQRNDTFGPKRGVLIQLFENPHGLKYEVITSTKAKVLRSSPEIGGDTWWPTFNWIILGCPQCQQHIGWEYVPMDKTDKETKPFFGLVLGNLLYENEADSLLLIPKSYRS